MEQWRIALRVIGMGWYMAFAILGGVFGGIWLGDKFGAKPAFLIIGILTGLVMAGHGVYQVVRPLMNNQIKGE